MSSLTQFFGGGGGGFSEQYVYTGTFPATDFFDPYLGWILNHGLNIADTSEYYINFLSMGPGGTRDDYISGQSGGGEIGSRAYYPVTSYRNEASKTYIISTASTTFGGMPGQATILYS